MPALDLLIPIIAIVFAAGLIQGLSGFGSALIAVPLLSLLLSVDTVVPLMALLGVLMSAVNLLHLHRAVRLALVSRLLIGYLIGTPIGLFALTRAPEAVMLGALGTFLGAYALLSLSGRQPDTPWLRERRLTLGTISGALGAAFSTNGPPIILHVAAHREWEADRQKATLVLFFLLSSAITVCAHALSGLVTREVLGWLAWSLPMLLAGTYAGMEMYRRLGRNHYQRFTFLLILATGCVLLWRAILGGD